MTRGDVSRYDAVLFDWSGTLVHDPSPFDRLQRALQIVDRTLAAADIAAMVRRMDDVARLPEVEAALRDEDTSAERHRVGNMLWFERSGLDEQLAAALYGFDDDPAHRPLYPDAAETLRELRQAGVKVAVVSDIHLDIRVHLASQGVGDVIDEYVLSFEHGCQKPDAKMFLTALDLLETAGEHTLMVGDRASHDGGAAEVGIATLILPPPPPAPSVRRLGVVTRMVR